MQIIFKFAGSPEQYVKINKHREVKPPSACPACGKNQCLEALGYYSRALNQLNRPGVLLIRIRRFRCLQCHISVSLLPGFAQPYRLLRNETIEHYFNGKRSNALRWWEALLRCYQRRFCSWLPELPRRTPLPTIQSTLPPVFAKCWRQFKAEMGHLDRATKWLCETFRITPFGRYRCHAVPPTQLTGSNPNQTRESSPL